MLDYKEGSGGQESGKNWTMQYLEECIPRKKANAAVWKDYRKFSILAALKNN